MKCSPSKYYHVYQYYQYYQNATDLSNHDVFCTGLSRKGEKAAHHAFKHQWSRIFRVNRKDNSAKTAKLQHSKRAFRKKEKLEILKCPGHEKETAQNDILVKELALSSEILGDRRPPIKKGNEKHNGPKRKIHKGNTVARNVGLPYPVSRPVGQKRTLISLPPLTNVLGNGNPASRTLLTAIGLLFNKKNHFEKDSNALTLAKVLLDRDQSFDSNRLTHDHYLHSVESQLDSLFNILRFLNASLSQKSMIGERKSTIHTELVNPTELGVAILRLLFGHNANLVMEPWNEQVLINGQTAARVSSHVHPRISSSRIRLPLYMRTFDHNKSIARRKHHKMSFSFALAKAISELIKSMAKEDLNNYMQKTHTRNKFARQEHLAKIPERYWPSKKKIDIQGNRKSWVLLKIPKSSEEIIHHQTTADEAHKEHDEEIERDKASAGIVDTLGKLSLDSNDGNTETQLKNGMNKDTRKDPTPEIKGSPTVKVGYSVRILPSLQGSSGIQAKVNQQTNTVKPLSNSQSTQAFADAVQKLLRAVQFSIKSLQGKQVIGHVPNISAVTNENPENAVNNRISSIVSDQLRTTEKTNTGTVRGISNSPTAINTVQLLEKQPVIPSTPTGLGPDKLSAFARARGQNGAATNENTILDPWKDLEPITKSISPTKKLGPSGNVLFESATELGVPRGAQDPDTDTVSHIQEGMLNIYSISTANVLFMEPCFFVF